MPDGNLFQQNTDLDIIALLIPFLTKKTFLDIGAAKGEFTRFFVRNGLKGTLFEPLPDCVSELSDLAKNTECVFSNYAIDDHDHKANFFHAFDKEDNDSQHFSSLYPLENDTRIYHKNIGEVQCRSLNSLVDEGFISSAIGVIKVDTEGNDLNVLKGMDGICAEILMCEYFMPKIYAGWELSHPVNLIQQMNKMGFSQYIAVKRIGNIELVSFNKESFVDKEWGNLIFISNNIYEQAELIIKNYIKTKENIFFDTILSQYSEMQDICDDRAAVIAELKEVAQERLALIEKLTAEIQLLSTKKSKWINKIIS